MSQEGIREDKGRNNFRSIQPKMCWRKDTLFNKQCWESWLSTCRGLKQGPYLSPCTNLKPERIKDLSNKAETLNLLEDKTGKAFEDIGVGKDFSLNGTTVA